MEGKEVEQQADGQKYGRGCARNVVFAWQGGEEEQGGRQRGRAILIQIVENNKIPEEISELFPPRPGCLIQHLQLRSLGQERAVGVGSGELAAPSSVPLSSITPSAQPDILSCKNTHNTGGSIVKQQAVEDSQKEAVQQNVAI